MKASEGALLAMIVDDDEALSIAAVWAALELPLSAIADNQTVERIADIAGIHPVVVRRRLEKLHLARALEDGGLSSLADKMLQAHVQIRLQGKRKT